jgi:uncharacterized coiled-coil DUF342 family protein
MTAEEELAKCKESNWENRRRADVAEGQLARAEAREKELREALRKLANEASGFMSMAVREVHGNTNIRVLELRITEARELLGKLLSGEPER